MIERQSENAGRTLREQVGVDDDRQSVAERARFIDAALELVHSRQRDYRKGLTLLAGAIVMALGLAVFGFVRDARRPLTFSIGHERRAGSLNEYIVSPSSEGIPLYFSDGTALTLEPTARARVEHTTGRGATVLIEDGGVDANVMHRSNSEWTFGAGPFLVHVTGTSFVMSWNPNAGLMLQMRAGAVHVDGPGLGAGITVKDHEHFSSLEHNWSGSRESAAPRLEVGPISPGVAVAPTSVSSAVEAAPNAEAHDRMTSSIAPERTLRGASVPPASLDTHPAQAVRALNAPTPSPKDVASSSAVASDSWSTLVARGEYSRVLEAASSRGDDTVLDTAREGDVEALADAARFSGQNKLAEQSLRALRRRFSGTAPAITAAFLLGRMADDSGGVPSAVKWYETYLSEAPSGAFTAEALGRRMLAFRRLNDPESTRLAARDYLARFPDGPYARIAREVALQ